MDEGDDALEELGLECYGLIDAGDPFERFEGMVMPDAENVAALAALVEAVGDHIEDVRRRTESLTQLRDVAAWHLLHEEGTRNA